jgi:hypothetical protein
MTPDEYCEQKAVRHDEHGFVQHFGSHPENAL